MSTILKNGLGTGMTVAAVVVAVLALVVSVVGAARDESYQHGVTAGAAEVTTDAISQRLDDFANAINKRVDDHFDTLDERLGRIEDALLLKSHGPS